VAGFSCVGLGKGKRWCLWVGNLVLVGASLPTRRQELCCEGAAEELQGCDVACSAVSAGSFGVDSMDDVVEVSASLNPAQATE
jgi:hypothetical protein